jgi:hypothetical protein
MKKLYDSRQADAIEITPAMIDGGVDALIEWVNAYGVNDVPAHDELVTNILRSSLVRFQPT